ncbi:hypothetical protein [Companilactobacillus kimchiensis]|uniref:Uncharacterized protein n=1 Tax=Companilactobacillus kimchiensis TaxID=993692 RepID=A0A0R2LBX0_9LACO|nr:hypothetical protein [Companilactobacillus kimchiensis]KRN96748.1 hypothetical protein IV57_GL001759 [Companilactobacillus kimchiensis]
MVKNKQIHDQLTENEETGKKFHTYIYEDEDPKKREISLDNFASFLSDKVRLTSNEDLDEHFKESLATIDSKDPNNQFKPTEISEYKDYNFEYKDIFSGDSADKEFNNYCMLLAMNCAYREDLNRSGWTMFHDIEGESKDQNMLRLRMMTNNKKFNGSYITDAIKGVVNSNSATVMEDFLVRDKRKSFVVNNDKITDEQRADDYLKWDIADQKKSEKDIRASLLDENKKNYKPRSEKEINEIVEEKKVQRRYKNKKEALDAVGKNRKRFNKSIDILIKELDIIYPEHVVILGKKGNFELVQLMTQSKKFDDFEGKHEGNDLRNLLINALPVYHYSTQAVPVLRDWYKGQKNTLLDGFND